VHGFTALNPVSKLHCNIAVGFTLTWASVNKLDGRKGGEGQVTSNSGFRNTHSNKHPTSTDQSNSSHTPTKPQLAASQEVGPNQFTN
jgi:hypothetical protein